MMKNRERFFKTAMIALSSLLALLAAALVVIVVDTRPRRGGDEWDAGFKRKGAYFAATHPYMIHTPFLAEKPKDVFRVFVLGGSQAMGAPYVTHNLAGISYAAGLLKLPMEDGIATWLKYYLAPLATGRRVEVVNACVSAQDLRASVNNLEWILQNGRPDLIVIMGGDNERKLQTNPFANYAALTSKSAYAALLPELARNYEDEIGRIVELADRHRTTVYVLTVADNLSGWKPVDEPDFAAGVVSSLVRAGRYRDALAQLKGGDPANALRLFYTAKCWEGLGDFAEARALYVRAKDHDKAFLRCRSAWNDITRKKARGRYVRMLDAEKLIEAAAVHGIPGFDLFWDYCHFKLPGNKLIAREIAKAYARDERLPDALAQGVDRAALPDFQDRNLRLLYLFKRFQWLRLGFHRTLAASTVFNSDSVRREYEQARFDDYVLSNDIRFHRGLPAQPSTGNERQPGGAKLLP